MEQKFSQATLPMLILDAFAEIASSCPWEEVRPGFFGQDVLSAGSPAVWWRRSCPGIRSGSFGTDQRCAMDPAAPFGGVKSSGTGRELGREGLEGYIEFKAISGAAAP